jgi:GT2 family glycosyltransferase/peptidoglycan/xylan/chitin deacetylase (PgdA/CDA1 family)
MKVSIIIPTYNRRKLLQRCLDTVLTQDFHKNEYEVIVVVDGSTDDTVEFLRALNTSCAFQFLIQMNCGQAVAKNAGVRLAKGELLLFLDDDLLCEKQLIQEHVSGHAVADRTLVCGPVLVDSESPRSLSTIRMNEYHVNEVNRFKNISKPNWPEDFMMGTNTSLRRDVFISSGGFDERFFRAYEDADLSLRLWRQGVGVRFQSNAIAYCYYTKTTDDWVRDGFWYGKNEVLLTRKHPNYRRCSGLARLGVGGIWKRSLRAVMTHFPASFDIVPGFCCKVTEYVPFVLAKKIGISILGLRRKNAEFHGALHQTVSWRALRNEFGIRLPVLLYHHVGSGPSAGASPWTVSVHKFAQQVRWLARCGYVGIRPSDWLAWVREGTPLPAKPVLLTFDDAYADLATYAFPILREYGFSAGAFVVTGWVGETKTLCDADYTQTYAMMNAEQIREWASQGIEFGAHSHTHQDLTTLDRSDLDEEITESQRRLTEILQDRVTTFAYPYGHYNERIRELVRSQVDMAFTVEEGVNTLPTDLDLLQRIAIKPGDSLFDLACRMQFGWNPIRSLTAHISVRSRARRAFDEIQTRILRPL